MSCTKTYIGYEARVVGVTQIAVFWLSHHVGMEVNSDSADTFAGIMNN